MTDFFNGLLGQWHFCNFHLKCHGVAPKGPNFDTNEARLSLVGNAAEASVIVCWAAAIWWGLP